LKVLAGHELLGREIHAVSPPTRRLSPKVKLLLNTLAAHAARPAAQWGAA